MSARSARRPLPALVFLLALAVLAVVVWIRVAGRDSDARSQAAPTCTTSAAPALPANGAITVTVLNGAGRDGLAKATLDAFVAAGFRAGNYDNATGVQGVGTITSGPNGVAAAKVVSFWVPGATLATDARQDTGVTVALGPGFTALPAPPAVAAAMAKAAVSQSTAPAAAPAAGAASSSAPATGSASASASASTRC